MTIETPAKKAPGALFCRVAETGRRVIAFTIDGVPARALEGDTVLTAVLSQRSVLRHADFSSAPRAGFCLMGACQDCWVSTESGERLRACSTPALEGMRIVTGGSERS
ncbi:(2Fe-2S)-binding protein [Arthrobacter sp. NPDC080086]|uniref:(2Fe-2S)-binding protein n=1 Tax=Arthrobacter sp. NPDC080086 TaxID=3155917 RepID=UPI00344B8B80